MPKFILRIGDNEVELEGATRDDAIKKVGLNPKNWQDNRGVKMESKERITVNKLPPPTLNAAKKQTSRPVKVEAKPIIPRRKPNITTEDVGRWYTDGVDVWKLDDFVPEPQVSMSKVASMGNDPQAHEIKKGNLSEFSNFRRLVPEPETKKRYKKKS
jgi:hypothetical protein